VAITVVVSCANRAQAHPGHHHAPNLRLRRDADGLFEIEASFVLAEDDRVRLRKHDGVRIWIPLAKLSVSDRDWVQKRLSAIQRLNALPELNESETDPPNRRERATV
jgi:hypothetical protein